MRTIRSGLIALAVTLCILSLASPCSLAAYTFVNVADQNTAAPSGNFTSFSTTVIGANSAAFHGFYSGGSGIFTGSGGPITTIAKTGDPAPSGTFTAFGPPTKLNATAFRGGYSGTDALFLGTGGPLTTIVTKGDAAPTGTFNGLGDPAMYDEGVFATTLDPNTVAFRGSYAGTSGIFLASSGALTTVVKGGDPAPTGTFQDFGDPDLTESTAGCCTPVPLIAFRGTYASTQGIFTKANGVLTTIATRAGLSVNNLGDPFALNNSVAFRVNTVGGGPQAIYSNFSGSLQQIVAAGQSAPSGTFTSFGDPVLTNAGIAFKASYGFGLEGIFARFGYTGSGVLGPIEPVIKRGDTLFGANVLSVSLSQISAQSSPFTRDGTKIGHFAFNYSLNNGRTGVALALAIPEPASASIILLAVLTAGIFPLARVRRAA